MKTSISYLTVFTVLLVLGSACSPTRDDRSKQALERARMADSSLPGMSVEKAVAQVLADLGSRVPIEEGRWYANRAIEHEDVEVYKVGYVFRQGGKRTLFGWEYYFGDNRLVPLTDYARQVSR